jgi:hypothetical protein
MVAFMEAPQWRANYENISENATPIVSTVNSMVAFMEASTATALRIIYRTPSSHFEGVCNRRGDWSFGGHRGGAVETPEVKKAARRAAPTYL